MQVHRDINSLPLFKNPVITIGTFDGVHTGHIKIIEQLKREASEIDGETIIITFDPHPRIILDPASKINLLNTPDEKIELLRKQKIDHLIVVNFTILFSEQSPYDYIKDFLVDKIHPHTLIIGYDHHFGKDRKGNYQLLEKYAAHFNYHVKEIPEHILNEVTISSTKIRNALLTHQNETANKYLGYHYFFEGKVVEGNKIGRTLGYPTANLEIADPLKLVPGNGVYVVQVAVQNKQGPTSIGENLNSSALIHNGMMSIGVRPTLDKNDRTIEVNIFDFDKDIYDQTIRVYVINYLREEKKFSGLPELQDEIAKDKINALKLLSEL
ncbi:MAG: bifunctional riboflavin kinase/FAD synthetase [Chitinophagaceae bacterium]|nr:bifunctional riboflavin kinase/FAD synthetase [Chitinophagaceae bacterium]